MFFTGSDRGISGNHLGNVIEGNHYAQNVCSVKICSGIGECVNPVVVGEGYSHYVCCGFERCS